MKRLELCVKRTFDIVGSFIVLLVLSPVLVLSALMIVCFMPGPVFFFQERVGKNGKVFKIYKFRTMKVDKEAEANFDVSRDSERRTKVGDFLRRFKIDEVVQLINVLKGDMSMVGPRPTFKRQTDKYNDFEKQRLMMRPGMTGLAQVNGNISLSWEERIIYDVQYIKDFSLLLDLKILFKTVLIVLFGEKKFKRTPIKNANVSESAVEERV